MIAQAAPYSRRRFFRGLLDSMEFFTLPQGSTSRDLVLVDDFYLQGDVS